jgi:hypothetical protein
VIDISEFGRFKVYLDTQFGPDLRGDYRTQQDAEKCVKRLRRQGWGHDKIRIEDAQAFCMNCISSGAGSATNTTRPSLGYRRKDEMSDVRQRIEQILIDHTYVAGDDDVQAECTSSACLWRGWFLGDWRRHIAEVLMSELGLTQEDHWGANIGARVQRGRQPDYGRTNGPARPEADELAWCDECQMIRLPVGVCSRTREG